MRHSSRCVPRGSGALSARLMHRSRPSALRHQSILAVATSACRHSTVDIAQKKAQENCVSTCTSEQGYTGISEEEQAPFQAVSRCVHAAARHAIGLAIACVLALAPVDSANASSTIRMSLSDKPEVMEMQQTMVEAWTAVSQLFFDGNFNGTDWPSRLQSAMDAAYASNTKESAFEEISTMLTSLGDPYTRIVPASQYRDFKLTTDGELSGVGLLIASEPQTHAFIVLAPMHNSPAERAGIHSGDVVLAVDGTSTAGLSNEDLGDKLRGVKGSSVKVTVLRTDEAVPGMASRAPAKPMTSQHTVTMWRDRVELSPIVSSQVGMSGTKIGYIKLASFSNNAASEMSLAMSQLQQGGSRGFILDLRNNPGGLVSSGMDVARLWLDGQATVFNVTGRDEDEVQSIVLDKGSALSDAPLVVLVNGNSASAAEILAGALHDNGRAKIMGDGPTYGKGRIQSAYELNDGSVLFVSVARYLTPGNSVIDHQGIRPDVTCTSPKDSEGLAPDILMYGPEATDHLFEDPCFLAAEKAISRQVRSRNSSSLPQFAPSATLPLSLPHR